MRRPLFIPLILLLAILMSGYGTLAANGDKIVAVYFYSPTCASCDGVSELLEKYGEMHENLELRKYDISDLRNKSLMNDYIQAYGVPEEDDGIIPIIFIGDKYFADVETIRRGLETEITSPTAKTLEIQSSGAGGYQKELERFKGLKWASVLFAGLVNGINPCSMSMLLFFLSLLTVKRVKILKIGVCFALGKFLMYLLLGTALFRFLSFFNFAALSGVIKALLAVTLVILIIMNMQDFLAAKAERYGSIKLQLPERLRKFNHGIIKRVSGFSRLDSALFISFFLGAAISLGEFLCTGQIYLAVIITIFQTAPDLGSQALSYLIIYNLGLILPLLILTLAVYKGREVFDVSDAIRERLHIIKIINILLLFVLGVIIFLFF
ncbi:cytochrome c biogenesis protein CcdA [Anaerobacterium chartisolvens]|uniref:Cytochrome c biogenesis protein CcdA n=1 Tax=Anaerobacterium chartisolvens TaxID=1297424 RepID=A0A369AZH9_9FIRM|nr:glutaredoxin [Anaerobacterium chartisolvens]RCX14842.1 cytochrome c biogenesis protein CcdA [Anaerobacterium chartisolvens]